MPLRLPELALPEPLVARLTALSERDGKPAFAYARMSQDREGAGLGIDRQLDEQSPLFERHGLRLAGVYADNDVSAYSGKPRPDYRDMLDALDTGHAQAVTCWHTDRLHRSVRELLDYIVLSEQRKLLTYGWRAGELDLSTPTGRAVAITQTAWARHESEHKADRIRAARLQAAQAGHRQGGKRPFGFEDDGETHRPSEAQEIVTATETILAGGSLRGVVRDLNARGVRTTFNAAAWDPISFKDVLLRPRNAGLMVYRGDVIGPAAWAPIVPEEQWRALVAVLTDPTRTTNDGSNRVRWLGSGIYLCGVCLCPTLRVSNSGGGRHSSYRCRGGARDGASSHVSRHAERVDELVEHTVVARLAKPDAVELLRRRDEVDTAGLHSERITLRTRLDELDDDLDNRRITRDRWVRRNANLTARLEEINREMADAATVDPLAGIVGAPDVEALWFGTRPDRSDGLSLDRRRAVLRAAFSVTVLRVSSGRGPGGSYFDPSSVRIKQREAG